MSSLILSIEDEPYVTEVIEQTLTFGGFEVVSVGDAERAIKFLQERTPDLILLDLMLPDIDGYSFCEVVRLTSKNRKIPIMIVSGCLSEEAEALGLKMGARDYLRKPFEPQELLTRVNRLLEARAKSGAPSRAKPGAAPAHHGAAQR